MPRLDILLARNLGASRRQVARMIKSGAIADRSGQQLSDARHNIPPAQLPTTVLVDGRPAALHHRSEHLMHKPVGVVTALRDARHQTAFDLLGELPLRSELRAVGRLDKDTSGLLLWTTDGSMLHRITHPRYAVRRVYQAALRREFLEPPDDLELDDGHRPKIVELGRMDASAVHPALARPASAPVYARITLGSGRFHEVRRIFAALGSEVLALCRVAYGPIALPPDLGAGGTQPTDLRAAFANLHPQPR